MNKPIYFHLHTHPTTTVSQTASPNYLNRRKGEVYVRIRLAPRHRLFRSRPRPDQDGFNVRLDFSIVIDVKDNDDIAACCNRRCHVAWVAEFQEELS